MEADSRSLSITQDPEMDRLCVAVKEKVINMPFPNTSLVSDIHDILTFAYPDGATLEEIEKELAYTPTFLPKSCHNCAWCFSKYSKYHRDCSVPHWAEKPGERSETAKFDDPCHNYLEQPKIKCPKEGKCIWADWCKDEDGYCHQAIGLSVECIINNFLWSSLRECGMVGSSVIDQIFGLGTTRTLKKKIKERGFNEKIYLMAKLSGVEYHG